AGSIFQFINIISGNAFGKATLFALSVQPYITSSIVIQLLTVAIPALERMSKDEEGKKKLTNATRWVTVVIGLVMAYGYAMLLSSYNMLTFTSTDNQRFFKYAVIIACYCAGTALIMWLGEKINEFGIGNGISIILFANIISRGPAMITTLWRMMFNDEGNFSVLGLLLAILSLAAIIAVVGLVVWFTNSERRIPIQYAKRIVGRKMYGGQTSHLPLKLNMSGVMPIIFASSIVAIPATIASFFPKVKFLQWINENFNYYTWPYLVVFLLLIIAFSFFYATISFNPVEIANNIKTNGGTVTGIRPGRPTAQYIQRILNRITLIGGIFLCFVAGLPMLITIIDYAVHNGSLTFSGLAFGGSSLLIVVGVALETVRELEAQITLRNYKGFLD
ncbi:MAG: preprotein translocase subunit SecY, partial [Eubacteriales bacterium]